MRNEGGLMNLAHNWENRSIVSAVTISKMKHSMKDLITENIKPILDVLKSPKHLQTVKGTFVNYFSVSAADPVRCYEAHGTAIETLMTHTLGGMLPKEFKTTINDSTLGKLNRYLAILRTFFAEETDTKISGAEVIHDRLAFAGANWKPLLQLRDAWAAEASTWLQQYNSLKRAYGREQEEARAAHARAEALGRRRGEADDGAPVKRMRVRSAQIARDKYPRSLTVNPGDTCIFVESATNPLWSLVKMDDGRTGLVSASRLQEVPLEEVEGGVLLDPSDEEELLEPPKRTPEPTERTPEPPSLEDVESAIQSFYAAVGGCTDISFSVAEIGEKVTGGPYLEADLKTAIEAICVIDGKGASTPAYKVTEDGKFCVNSN